EQMLGQQAQTRYGETGPAPTGRVHNSRAHEFALRGFDVGGQRAGLASDSPPGVVVPYSGPLRGSRAASAARAQGGGRLTVRPFKQCMRTRSTIVLTSAGFCTLAL